MTPSDPPREAPVSVVPYDPAWPSLFEQERQLLQQLLARWITGAIEHVGSTAVPGLAAKPVIDVMVGVTTLEASRPAIAVMTDAGYAYFPYRAEVMHWFCKPSPAFRTHHVHLVPYGSRLWRERLAFRDHLRRDSAAAAAYAQLKYRLAKQYEFDREAYTDAKEPFVREILRVALPREGAA